MKIINGRKVYEKELKKLKKIPANGWDRYDGRNHQWYTLYATKLESGDFLYNIDAHNSGSCYGDYSDTYFINKGIIKYVADKFYDDDPKTKLSELFGDIDESDEFLMEIIENLGL